MLRITTHSLDELREPHAILVAEMYVGKINRSSLIRTRWLLYKIRQNAIRFSSSLLHPEYRKTACLEMAVDRLLNWN
jgi:hypothetical protein